MNPRFFDGIFSEDRMTHNTASDFLIVFDNDDEPLHGDFNLIFASFTSRDCLDELNEEAGCVSLTKSAR